MIVAAIIPEGVDEAVASHVNSKIDEFSPDYWLLLQPDSYIFFFLQKRQGNERAAKGIELLRSLGNSNSRLKALRIGQAVGPLIADFSWFGWKVKSPPIGIAANEAHKLARGLSN